MSLRDVFLSMVRDATYMELKRGLLRDWKPELVFSLVDEAMNEKLYDINLFLQNYSVTIENMSGVALRVAREILIPHVSQKRVE